MPTGSGSVRARTCLAKERSVTAALLLRRVPFAETGLIVTLLTERLGVLAALARGARRSQKRLVALEPIHLLEVTVEVTPAHELATLVEARLLRPRLKLTACLDAMKAAGRLLRWVRAALPAHSPEPAMWAEVNLLLDSLDTGRADARPDSLLAVAGLRALIAAGWGLELSQCVGCSTPCPESKRVRIDVQAGGVVCRSCGGGGIVLGVRPRQGMLAALRGQDRALDHPDDVAAVLDLIDQAFAVHGQGRPRAGKH